jgi:hypothetical protein
MKYTIIQTPTGDPLWKVIDEDGALTGIQNIMDEFISSYSDRIHGWSLSIFDTLSRSTVEIEAPVEEMSKIAAYVYTLEHAAPLDFIGLNSLTDSIVVGMSLYKGNFHTGCCYKAENGKLVLQEKF